MEKLMREIQEQHRQDKVMLESMSAALRSGMQFSFNNNDMADLLDRLREEHVDHMVIE